MTHDEIRRHKPNTLISELDKKGFDIENLKSILSHDYTIEDIVYAVMIMSDGLDPNDYSGNYNMYRDSTPWEMSANKVDPDESNSTTQSSKPDFMTMSKGLDPNDYSGNYMYSDNTPGDMSTNKFDSDESNSTTQSSKPDFSTIESSNNKKTKETFGIYIKALAGEKNFLYVLG